MAKAVKEVEEISLKNTKQQLLDAYQALVEKIDSNRNDGEPVIEKKKSGKIEGIVRDIEAAAKTALSELVEKINATAKELEDINRELEDSKRELSETYRLTATAGTLQEFLKLKIEEETEWEKKFLALKESYASETARLVSTRKQQEQEYDYEVSLKRRKDEDKFAAERQAKVEALERRESAVAEKETELEDLRSKVVEFEKILSESVNIAVAKAEKTLKEDLEHKFALEKKDAEMDIKLKAQTITGLETNLKAQESEIASLKTDLAASMQRMTILASSVITATSNSGQRSQGNEKVSEETK